MLQRVLARENADARTRESFRARGLNTYRQLVQRPLWDVAHTVDVSMSEMQKLMQKIALQVAPASRTVLDMFLESSNYPMFLRTTLPSIDQALSGGIHCGGITEFTGIPGIGKSQWAMTLAVRCAIDYLESSVLYFDTEHNFSAKRLIEIATTRLRLRDAQNNPDADIMVESVVKRVRVIKVETLVDFNNTLKDLDETMVSQKVKLLIIDSVAALFVKPNDDTIAQREHQMLKLSRDIRLLADTYQAFAVVTNRAVIAENESGAFTRPLLGDTWAHCVTTRFVLERHVRHRVVIIMKSPVAGQVMVPFTIQTAGIESVVESEDIVDSEDFGIHDELLRNFTLASLPLVDHACTLESKQYSPSESNGEKGDEQVSFLCDIVSDSNGEEEIDSAVAELLLEER